MRTGKIKIIQERKIIAYSGEVEIGFVIFKNVKMGSCVTPPGLCG
jgi:hypothetical protein